jgi:gas vesicle protein
MEKQNDNGKLITGLIIGAAVGAVLGVLLAPNKGSDTRKKVFEGAEDMASDLLKKFNKATGKDPASDSNDGSPV